MQKTTGKETRCADHAIQYRDEFAKARKSATTNAGGIRMMKSVSVSISGQRGMYYHHEQISTTGAKKLHIYSQVSENSNERRKIKLP